MSANHSDCRYTTFLYNIHVAKLQSAKCPVMYRAIVCHECGVLDDNFSGGRNAVGEIRTLDLWITSLPLYPLPFGVLLRFAIVFNAVHRRTLARSPTLPTFQVAGVFALPAATVLSSLLFTAALLAAEHFRLLALRCGTACHRRLRRYRLWPLSALDSRRFCSPSHILTIHD